MHVYEVRRERLRELLQEIKAADLARQSGVDATLITRYLYEPGRKGAKNISEQTARKLEHGGHKLTGWLDRQHASAGLAPPVAHGLSLREPDHAPTLKWGEDMDDGKLPQVFWVALPDDSMAPRAPAGKRVQFTSTIKPDAGDGVLVRDRAGGLYFRLYRGGGAGGRWTAAALNPAYDPLDSERDGLEVLAVLTAEGGRWR